MSTDDVEWDMKVTEECLRKLKRATTFDQAMDVATIAMNLRKTTTNQNEQFRVLLADVAKRAIVKAETFKATTTMRLARTASAEAAQRSAEARAAAAKGGRASRRRVARLQQLPSGARAQRGARAVEVSRRRPHLDVELRAHDVVVVAGEDGDARALLPVPDADRLVVRRRHDPRVLHVELHGADVVEVAEQRKQAAPQLVVPYFDFVVVTSSHKDGLRNMKVNSAHRT